MGVALLFLSSVQISQVLFPSAHLMDDGLQQWTLRVTVYDCDFLLSDKMLCILPRLLPITDIIQIKTMHQFLCIILKFLPSFVPGFMHRTQDLSVRSPAGLFH